MGTLRNVMWCLVVMLAPYSLAQESDRIKIAEGEYMVSEQGDFGIGPPETEIFHLRESWTLWRTPGGSYEVEGERSFDSPRDTPHVNSFSIQLTHDLRVTKMTEFAQLNFRRDSGPLTCDFLTNELRCSSGARDPAHGVDLDFEIDRPYGFIWPISAFSLASLVHEAGETKGRKVPVEVLSLEELNPVLPVLSVCAYGFVTYLGDSETPYVLPNQSWRPHVYELDAGPIRKMFIWTSPEGIVLAAERPGWPKGRMQLVRFVKFNDF